ncbi:MAG: tetratricopeptide repeat protein, partial [Coriobacteriales bacterium]|nr:tetratricopeptide repeat protein [Coriobacteriales bacterium]
MGIVYTGRGTETRLGLQRIFLCAPSGDEDLRDRLVADILSQDAGADVVVAFSREDNVGAGEQEREQGLLAQEVAQASLVVVLASPAFFERGYPIGYAEAKACGSAILPIAASGSLLPELSEREDSVHALAMDDPEYRVRLKAQLDAFLGSSELQAEVKKLAFDGSIFLSYRKKDIALAREFMRRLHDIEDLRRVAIWYDDYLMAGRDFNAQITDAIMSTGAFVLLVTPHLLEQGNYVMTTEFPYAIAHGRPVLAIENQETDKERFDQLYPEATDFARIDDARGVSSLFRKGLSLKPTQASPAQRDYLLGMAYFSGIDVEKDVTRALTLLASAAEQGSGRAADQLALIHQKGINVPIDNEAALKYTLMLAVMLTEQEGYESLAAAEIYERGGNILFTMGAYDEALEQFGKTLEIRLASLGEAHAETATAYSNISKAHEQARRYDEALDFGRKALAIRQQEAPDSLELAQSHHNLGSILFVMGDKEQAAAHQSKALEILERTLGSDHPETARVLAGLAAVAEEEGAFERAIELGRRALAVLDRQPTQTNLYVRVAANASVGNAYRELGDARQALPYLESAVTLLEKMTGVSPRSVAYAYDNLGKLYWAQGRYRDAVDVYSKELALVEELEAQTRPAAPYSVVLCTTIANALDELGEQQEAMTFKRKALDIHSAHAPADDPAIGWEWYDLALSQLGAGDSDAALQSLKKALAIYERALPPAHPEMRKVYDQLISSHYHAGSMSYERGEHQRSLEH